MNRRCPVCWKRVAKAGDNIAPHYCRYRELCPGSYEPWHTTLEDTT